MNVYWRCNAMCAGDKHQLGINLVAWPSCVKAMCVGQGVSYCNMGVSECNMVYQCNMGVSECNMGVSV